MKKRITALLTVLLLLALPCSAAIDVPDPTRDFFINDYADVISSTDELIMQSKAENLYHACGAQVVIVTLPSLEGEEIQNVSLNIARSWGIGSQDKDNGLLLLFSAEEPRVRIEVGNGLEGAIPDSKAGRLLDTYMLPAYPDYSTGLRETQNALINETYLEYGLSPDQNYTPMDSYEEDEPGLTQIIGTLLLIIGAIVLFIRHPHLFYILLHIIGRGGGRGGRGGGFSGGGASR